MIIIIYIYFKVKRKNKSKKLLTIEEILKPQSKVKSFGSNRSKDKNVSRYNLSKYTKEQVKQINKRKAEGKIKKVIKKKRTGSIIARDLWEETGYYLNIYKLNKLKK